MRRTLSLCLLLAALPRAAWAGDFSILPDRELTVSRWLQLYPAVYSYGALLHGVLQPVVYSVEESGGFSDADPERYSSFGDSPLWNRWSFEGFDISDPYFTGAAALRVPWRVLESFSLRSAESPSNIGAAGPSLRLARKIEPNFGAHVDAGGVGDIWPGARPLMDVFSGSHARDRNPPPPEERRRVREHFDLHLSDSEELAGFSLAYGAEVERGVRRFLSFDSQAADLRGVYDEPYTVASFVLSLTPDDRAYQVYALAEYRARQNAFAELNYGREETAQLHSMAFLFGLLIGKLRLGLLLKPFSLVGSDDGFVRDLADPDGEALEPWYPTGDFFSLGIDAAWADGPYFFELGPRAVFMTPDRLSWSNPITFHGQQQGRIDWQSAASTQIYGHDRIGVRGELDQDLLGFEYQLYGTAAYALPGDAPGLAHLDVGAKAKAALRFGNLEPFLLLAKTPLPYSPELVRLLDPAYLTGRRFLSQEGQQPFLIDSQGGAFIDRGDRLAPGDIYSAALGAEMELAKGLRLEALANFKAYRGLPRLRLERVSSSGETVDGAYFYGVGEKRYLLDSRVGDTPIYFGGHLQVIDEGEHHLISAGFSAFNAVGESPFGNGSTANDVAAVTYLSASPNAALHPLANLDGDRAFIVKLLAGWEPIDGLWLFLSSAFYDGQPFTFFDAHEHDGQVVLTHHQTRGSPFQGTPLSGPREDFQLQVDLSVRYSLRIAEQNVILMLAGTNVLDFGNEIAERGTGPYGRAALEAQVPRGVTFGVEIEPDFLRP